MNTAIRRFFYAMLVAFFVATSAFGPAYAQSPSQTAFSDVKVVTQDGWSARGKHAVADDFVIVCPTQEVLDPSHPCSNNASQISRFDDYVLVCPIKKELGATHPCTARSEQISKAGPDNFALVCPVKEVLDPSHPCAQQNASAIKFKIPGDFVVTCPVREVLEPQHPCAR